ncbi:uncharacterized protein VP01_266g6 [Puccinia sorghi]|uniref:DUF8040 domain-containing protein n=1 Tax=Puccinia sorghi TaxID=27349 RepID=A0A0L6V3X8_9BASI|nr:uncharacterized protein VP01_266g6 [Puccinia sorghi]
MRAKGPACDWGSCVCFHCHINPPAENLCQQNQQKYGQSRSRSRRSQRNGLHTSLITPTINSKSARKKKHLPYHDLDLTSANYTYAILKCNPHQGVDMFQIKSSTFFLLCKDLMKVKVAPVSKLLTMEEQLAIFSYVVGVMIFYPPLGLARGFPNWEIIFTFAKGWQGVSAAAVDAADGMVHAES